LFEFYRRVYRKLTVDLKVPFALKDGQRQEDTPVHEALREALVNTLVHADYTGRVSVLIVKRPDMFGFRNPGGLRLPIEQVIRGGESDCRNRILHQMFLLVGLGERGGSGMPRIYRGWKSQHWRPPALFEKDEPEQTLLSLHMADLLPEKVVTELQARFGTRFAALDYTGRLVLATAAMERVVSHNRLLELCDAHTHDLSLLLARLVKQGMLESDGRSRGTVYFLPGEMLPTPEQVFMGPVYPLLSELVLGPGLEHSEVSSEHSEVSSEHLEDFGEQYDPDNGARDVNGRLVSPLLDAPIVDNLDVLSSTFRSMLESQGADSRNGRLSQEKMELVLLALCKGHYMTISTLAKLVDRNPDGLRQQHISRLTRSGALRLAFPTKPTHERQAYKTAEE
jgi:hypothetical protein